MKDTQLQLKLSSVPPAKQGREVPDRWKWTEASVWNERMLATLERGIKGGKWFSLIDKVWKMENLQSATQKLAKGKSPKKTDGRKCHRYLEQSHWRLPPLQDFKHSHRTTFAPLDSWIRQRLRTILRKRHKGNGRARGRDHQRWPNAYFAELGLISLATARAKASQSYMGH